MWRLIVIWTHHNMTTLEWSDPLQGQLRDPKSMWGKRYHCGYLWKILPNPFLLNAS